MEKLATSRVSPTALSGKDAGSVLHGTAAALGTAIDKALVLSTPSERQAPQIRVSDPLGVEKELGDFKISLGKAKEKLEELAAGASNTVQKSVIQFQVMVLKDNSLISGITKAIGVGYPARNLPPGTAIPPGTESVKLDAPSAIWLELQKYINTLRASGDKYLAERTNDIESLRNFLLDTLEGKSPAVDQVASITERCIVVAEKLTPGQASALKPELVAGIVTAAGSQHDHVAVIARSFDIPLVVGVKIDGIKKGDTLIVDGHWGEVIVNPGVAEIEKARNELESAEISARRLPIKERAPMTRNGDVVELSATMDSFSQVETIKRVRAEGVGLFRTEWMHLGEDKILSEDEQFKRYSEVLKELSPSPVVFRIMDLGADKVLHAAHNVAEPNPALGARGIRLALELKEQILIPQVRAILRAAVYGKPRILIPMVNGPGEIRAVRQIIDQQSKILATEGIPHNPNLQVGAMIETPAAALSAYRIYKESDFGNVGSNDMTQYTLALDRENTLINHHYQPHDPSLIETYRNIIRARDAAARDAEVAPKPLLVCGEASSNAEMLPVFIGLGYRAFSVPPKKIEVVNYNLSLLDTKECEALVRELRDPVKGADTAEVVHQKLKEFKKAAGLC